MTFQLRRAWCRLVHRGHFLGAAIVGHGAWTCERCKAGFADLVDAGRLLLHPLDLHISPARHLQLEREQSAPVTFEAGTFTVRRKGKVINAGRFRGAA
jgi:hypothetical protein